MSNVRPTQQFDSRRQEDSQADRLARAKRGQEDAQDGPSLEDGLKADEQLVEERQLEPGYFIRRFIINSAFYFTWLPYIVVIAARERSFQAALIFGLAFSGFCVFFQAAMRAFGQRRELPYILDMAFFMFFIVYLPIYVKANKTDELFQWELVALHFWLFFVMLVTVLAKQPFTMQYAREAAPEEAWSAESFKSVCDHLAGVWAGAMGLTACLCLAPACTKRFQAKDPLNVMFNYVWPLVAFILLLFGTRTWPAMIRRIYYIPRMLKSSVKPDPATAQQDPASTTATDTTGSNGERQQSERRQQGSNDQRGGRSNTTAPSRGNTASGAVQSSSTPSARQYPAR